jgi:large subunit ribosomal protein L35
MPKQKTHKGLAKRIKVTRRGKVMVPHAGKSHLMTGTSPKGVRNKRGRKRASRAMEKNLARMLRQG